MKNVELIYEELNQAKTVLDNFCNNKANIEQIAKIGDKMIETLNSGNKIIACGNGGSYCDAMHFAEELSGRYRKNRKALSAVAISDGAHITCCANDFGYENIYAKYIEAIGKREDLLLLFTSSGHSTNLVNAAKQAHQDGIFVVSLTGKSGGEVALLSDMELRVDHDQWADRIQEIHIKIVHILLRYIETNMGFE